MLEVMILIIIYIEIINFSCFFFLIKDMIVFFFHIGIIVYACFFITKERGLHMHVFL